MESNMAKEINQELRELGVMIRGEDGKHRATKALVEGRISGWRYDPQKKVAYQSGNSLKIQLDLEDVK